MRLDNFRIGPRLALSFGVIVAAMLVSMAAALTAVSDIEHRLEDIVLDNNYKTKLTHEMVESVHIVSRVMRTIVLLQDDAAMATERKKLEGVRAKYDAALEAMTKTAASEKGRVIRAKIAEAQAAARALNNQVLDLAFAHKDAEALELLLKQAAPATERWQDALDEHVALQEANTAESHETAKTAYQATVSLLVGVTAVAVLIAVLIGWRLSLSVTRPLRQAVQVADRIAAGDLSAEPTAQGKDECAQLLGALAAMTHNLRRLVEGVRGNAESVATASQQIASGNTDLSTRTEQQAGSLQQTASSMEQLTSAVKQSADNAAQGNQLAQTASSVAERGGAVVEQVVGTMREINDSSKKIADIIGVIDGIAFQTNILALNAAVEAARAGEQGRGFAVVASEVRSLAQRSADAAREIKQLIGASVERVASGTALVDEAGRTMREIVTSIQRVTDLMGEITAAAGEQSAGIGQVNDAVAQMDQATQQNAALVEQAAAAAASLREQAGQLVEAVAAFRVSA